jgi:trehalose 6-phosphate phosphatase
MNLPLFEHLEEIDRQLRVAPAVLLCAGFDGTLVALMASPDQVVLPPALRELFRGLLSQGKVVPVIISGRSLEDLRPRVGVPGLVCAGNHGLEIRGPNFAFVEPTALECRPALRKLVEDLTGRLQPIAGAWVEDKGLTASVHYRQVAPEAHEEVRRQVHAVLASANHPFVLGSGQLVFEIRPRVYWNKGSAVRWIAEQMGRPDALSIYLGDDISDEDAFAALPEAITIKVGDPTQTATRYRVEGPAEVQRFLTWLASRFVSRKS